MIGVLLCLGSQLSMTAQDFNPDNPAEPYQYNKVTVLGSPSEAVSWLSGAGYYKEGESVQLSSSRRSNVYTFSHWEKDGVWYSNEQSPKYTMDNNAHTFTACYEYTPSSPDEPWISDNRLYLVAEPLTACTFNLQSGTSFKYDQTVSLAAYANSTYTFLGWYKDGVLQSKNLSYAFNMPEGDVKLVARFEYNPINPSEPKGDGSQTNVQTTPTGDSNGDGVVDVADAVRVINICLSTTYDEKSDANNDGVVDVADAVRVINLCLKVK